MDECRCFFFKFCNLNTLSTNYSSYHYHFQFNKSNKLIWFACYFQGKTIIHSTVHFIALFPRKKPRAYEKQILIFMQLFKYLKFKTEKYGNLSQKTHFDWHELVEMNGQRHLNGAFMNIKEMKYNFEKWTKLRNRSRSSIITRYANEQLVVIKKLNVIKKN